jgi:hypothetical protein
MGTPPSVQPGRLDNATRHAWRVSVRKNMKTRRVARKGTCADAVSDLPPIDLFKSDQYKIISFGILASGAWLSLEKSFSTALICNT